MSSQTSTLAPRPSTPDPEPKKHRPAWRQRLVDAERGISHGFRLDSTFYGHFFVGSIVLATAVVLGISLIQWTIVVLALTLVLSAEMFNQVLKAIWQTTKQQRVQSPESRARGERAAVSSGSRLSALDSRLLSDSQLSTHFTEPARTVLRIGTGAVFVTILGATIAIGLIFGQRLLAMLAG